MHKSSLLKIISALPVDKLEAFALFLSSPYFNSNATLSKLFAIIKPHSPQFDSEELVKEKCFASLYPSKPYKYGTLRNLMTQLNALLREFLIQEKLKESKEIKDRLLLQQYSGLRLEKPFKELYESRFAQIEKNQKIGQQEYLWRYLFLLDYQESALCDFKNINPIHIHKTIFYLDRFILLAKMNMEISSNSRLISLSEPPPSTIIKFSLKESTQLLKAPEKLGIQVIQDIIQSQKNTRLEDIPFLIENFKLHSTKFSNFQSNILLSVVINLTNRVNTTKGNKYIDELFSLIKFGVEENIYPIKNGGMQANRFANIILTALTCHNYLWATDFIKNNLNLIPESDRKEFEIYAELKLQFYQNKFIQVSRTLSTIKIRDSKLGFHFRLLMMKNAIELAIRNSNTAHEGLLLLDSIDKYLRRKASKKPKSSKLFLNFVKVARRLFRNIQNNDIPNSSGLKEMLKPDIPIAARQWLFEKIESLDD